MEPREIVAHVESEMSQYRPCPLCGQYGGLEQHQAGCPYLSLRSTPEEGPDLGDQDAKEVGGDGSPSYEPAPATDTFALWQEKAVHVEPSPLPTISTENFVKPLRASDPGDESQSE